MSTFLSGFGKRKFFEMKRMQTDLFSPLMFVTALVFFYVPVKWLLIWSNNSKNHFYQFQSVAEVELLTVIYLLSAYGTYSILSFTKRKSTVNALYSSEMYDLSACRCLCWLVAVLFVIAYEIYFFTIQVGSPIAGAGTLTGEQIKLAAGRFPIMSILLRGFIDSLVFMSVCFLWFAVLKTRRYIFELVLLNCLILTYYTHMGARGSILFSLIFSFLIVYNCFVRRFKLVELVPVGALIFCILSILALVRRSQELSLMGRLSDGVESYMGSPFQLVLQLIDRRFDSYFPNLFKVFDHVSLFEGRYGADYFFGLLQVIPRAIWDDKPTTLIREANIRLELQSSGGTGVAPIFEAWVNFGLVGVIGTGVLGAILLKSLQRHYCTYRDRFDLFFMVVFFKIGFVVGSRFFIGPGVSHNTVELLVAVGSIYFWGILFRRFLIIKKIA